MSVCVQFTGRNCFRFCKLANKNERERERGKRKILTTRDQKKRARKYKAAPCTVSMMIWRAVCPSVCLCACVACGFVSALTGADLNLTRIENGERERDRGRGGEGRLVRAGLRVCRMKTPRRLSSSKSSLFELAACENFGGRTQKEANATHTPHTHAHNTEVAPTSRADRARDRERSRETARRSPLSLSFCRARSHSHLLRPLARTLSVAGRFASSTPERASLCKFAALVRLPGGSQRDHTNPTREPTSC